MAGNVLNGGIDIIYNGDGKNIVEKFAVKVILSCRNAGDDLRRFRIKPKLYRDQSLCTALFGQPALQSGQEGRRNVSDRRAHV